MAILKVSTTLDLCEISKVFLIIIFYYARNLQPFKYLIDHSDSMQESIRIEIIVELFSLIKL